MKYTGDYPTLDRIKAIWEQRGIQNCVTQVMTDDEIDFVKAYAEAHDMYCFMHAFFECLHRPMPTPCQRCGTPTLLGISYCNQCFREMRDR